MNTTPCKWIWRIGFTNRFHTSIVTIQDYDFHSATEKEVAILLENFASVGLPATTDQINVASVPADGAFYFV